MKTAILTAILSILAGYYCAGQSGAIHGKIFDETMQPMPGATIVIDGGTAKVGVQTDLDGNFKLKPLDPGVYNIKISFMGYTEQVLTGIQVYRDKIQFIPDVKMQLKVSTVANGKEIVVTAVKTKLIDKDNPSIKTIDSKTIRTMPDARNLPNLVRTFSDIKVSDDGQEIYFRGARNDASAFFIDGVRVEKLGTMPRAAIGSVNVYTGGVPAKYGDFTGGVVVIETRSWMEIEAEQKAKESRMQ